MQDFRLNGVDPELFLNTYWQKKPCIIRQGLVNFIDPVDEHELAGLAMEEEIDARIISRSKDGWGMEQGPFTEHDFTALCVNQWSLLVQSVNHHIPDSQALMSAFNFLPFWRTDDLMISYSVAGAGVGPHLDQYDVFIVQGKGSRRWQIGQPGEHQKIYPHPQLSQIETFEPVIDEIFYPGDIIYIPPGWPHNGIALEDCINYSVGFRAPSQQDLILSLADFAVQTNSFNQRFSDADIASRSSPALILDAELCRFRKLMTEAIQSDDFERFILTHLSQSAPGDELEPDPPFTPDDIYKLLEQGVTFSPRGGLKPLYQQSQSDDFSFYLDGQAFKLPQHSQPLMIQLLNQDVFQAQNLARTQEWLDFIQMLTILVNTGYWFPEC
ncbi:JmjC domain-containing protein [Neptunicella sp. SCSIO 80796]|uniref:JmjC domain-containing protein n=1 Tax=Neptunicella plasticusilytica TaxID=3117012 RepID=UPI003A4D435E